MATVAVSGSISLSHTVPLAQASVIPYGLPLLASNIYLLDGKRGQDITQAYIARGADVVGVPVQLDERVEGPRPIFPLPAYELPIPTNPPA